MPSSRNTSAPRPSTFCVTCEGSVTVHWWQNENDPGDCGIVRDCGHGDYVRR